MNILETPYGRHAPGILNVVIEVPKGSKKKYCYNPQKKAFYVDYTFSLPMPTEYGWIPETIGDNGERLEVMVITKRPSWPGNVYQVRPIGLLKFKDKSHKVIAVMLGDDKYISVHDIGDIDNNTIKKIVCFFEPFFQLDGWLKRTEGLEVVKQAHQRYLDKQQEIARRREERKTGS